MPKYIVHAAQMPHSGRRLWLLVTADDLEPMVEARDFSIYLAGKGRSENTIRTYIPKVAAFLNWAYENAVDWRAVTLPEMAKFKFHLEAPIENQRTGKVSTRQPVTVNLTLTAVLEFLRFCARAGWIERVVVERMVQPKHLTFVPPNFDPGESGQFRFQRVKELRARNREAPPKYLTTDQVLASVEAATNPRDRFLLLLLTTTGIRVGEALGLRGSDIHFLPDSTALGCEVRGAHVEVVRREDNVNRAWAKTLNRSIPVPSEVVESYRDYIIERDSALGDKTSEYVFVSLSEMNAGTPLTYAAVMSTFRRLRRLTGIPGLSPHMFRHTFASRMVRTGVNLEVLQALMGHSSARSTSVYFHVDNDQLRDAVDRGQEYLDGFRGNHE